MNNQPISADYFHHLSIRSHDLTLSDGLALITSLQSKHLENLPFSSLGVLLGRDLSLDMPALFSRLLEQRLGGYCFEHNKVFFSVLQEQGFTVRPLMARVLNNRDFDAPKSHRMTLLSYNNEHYIVDVGFGGYCPDSPIKLSAKDTTCKDGSEFRIITDSKGDYLLQLKQAKGYFNLYSFDLQNYLDPDFEMGHFYSYRHPKAGFVNNLVISHIVNNERFIIRNSEFLHISNLFHEQVTKQNIDSAHDLQEILGNRFNLSLSDRDSDFIFNSYCLKSK